MTTVEPGLGALVLTGLAPDIVINPDIILEPLAGSIVLQGKKPEPVYPFAPAPITVVAQGRQPGVYPTTPGVNVTPAPGVLKLQRGTPGAFYPVAPKGKAFALRGKVPNVALSGYDPDLLAECEAIWQATIQQQLAEQRLRREDPLVQIWDGEWNLQHLLAVDYSSEFSFIANDSGPGRSEIPFDTPVAQWIADESGRIKRGEGRNVHVTVEYCGARWSGRMDKFAIEQREDGDVVLVVDWLHDYENLKWYQCWSNPFFPSFFQAPRAWILPGPVDWVLKTTLFVNLLREHNPLLTLDPLNLLLNPLSFVDDLIDFQSWFLGLDQSNWPVVVKPKGFLESMASGVIWGVGSSRWATWHDMAYDMLEDAEMTVTCTRYLPGDDPPWPGANLRFGTLVIDIEDNSGVYVGTSHGGTVWDGLARTFFQFSDDFIDSTVNLVQDTSIPQDYFRIGHKYTDKALPYVIFLEGDNSPIETSQFINSPAKAKQVSVGGHSAPGINEAISASIQAVGDIAGGLLQIGSFGGTIDTLVKPLYEDTIAAWNNWLSTQRAKHNGWSGYFEYFQGPDIKAFTISALMVLRAGFWATRTIVSWKVSVVDGLPFLIGDRGLGHFFLDDRVGLVLQGDATATIHMDRCRKIDLAWDEENPPEWAITIGDDRVFQDPAQRAWAKLERLIAALRDVGVY